MPVTREDLALVERVASRFARRSSVDRDDVVSDGMLALSGAVSYWDMHPEVRHDVTRVVFVTGRVRDRVVEGIRTRNGRLRGERYPRQDFERSMLRLDHELGGDGREPLAALVGREDSDLADVDAADLMDGLPELLEGLPDREREVVQRTFLGGETLAAVGRDLGVGESRASKIRTQALARLRAAAAAPPQHRPVPTARAGFGLTSREREVLAGMADGLTNDEIGVALEVAEGTIKTHVKAVLGKLHARSRTHAVGIAFRAGVVR